MKKIIRIVLQPLLILFFLYSAMQVFNIASLYKDQIDIAGSYPEGYTLESYASELKFWFYFYICSSFLIPIIICLMIYKRLNLREYKNISIWSSEK
ncbi:hypothetical protein [Adhaeribacter terreus]|uniref:Uncharacterized protein n=1 Tax=Adhaeribacter terreus TaxID=529703 RepID=A0ABW0E7B3_9BACT